MYGPSGAAAAHRVLPAPLVRRAEHRVPRGREVAERHQAAVGGRPSEGTTVSVGRPSDAGGGHRTGERGRGSVSGPWTAIRRVPAVEDQDLVHVRTRLRRRAAVVARNSVSKCPSIRSAEYFAPHSRHRIRTPTVRMWPSLREIVQVGTYTPWGPLRCRNRKYLYSRARTTPGRAGLDSLDKPLGPRQSRAARTAPARDVSRERVPATHHARLREQPPTATGPEAQETPDQGEHRITRNATAPAGRGGDTRPHARERPLPRHDRALKARTPRNARKEPAYGTRPTFGAS
jgi:hypothetical protein